MSSIRAVSVRLIGLEDRTMRRRPLVAVVRLVVDDGPLPRVIMHDGEPFVLERQRAADLIYAQQRAVRIDPGMIIEGES